MSVIAYQRTRTLTESPRAAECRLLREITGALIDARDRGMKGLQLAPSLFRNREVWNTFSLACSARGNQLPDPLRAAIISLGLWVERYTSEVMAGKETVDALIDVNRAIIDGLGEKTE